MSFLVSFCCEEKTKTTAKGKDQALKLSHWLPLEQLTQASQAVQVPTVRCLFPLVQVGDVCADRILPEPLWTSVI